ncbi:Peptidoglycan glycosyltransferase protein [Dioscorea alata]|uniref:Peptidoglycan glycosyltransferase protein n=1 Tax=Dioscorea alata TaxID=55571 RepID=A0ACB7VXH4_DIOAL|nr:Peptidoglycan glycosyltransferase protein [Dioscorea alata]
MLLLHLNSHFPSLASSSPSAKPRLTLLPSNCHPSSPKRSIPSSLVQSLSFGILPRHFREKWGHLMEESKEAESKVSKFPVHLIQAVVASEDQRFFYHLGVDPHGIARAVIRYPNGGGGSTITQQLVKGVFLSSERKISRKFVEGILSLILERRLSKSQILYSYLSKMYWGHGKFGIESASMFYFGKHPSFLTVGEAALLAGILPAPEILNPFTDPERGKASQRRVLRRMVAAGFLEMESALLIASQPLYLCNKGVKFNIKGKTVNGTILSPTIQDLEQAGSTI